MTKPRAVPERNRDMILAGRVTAFCLIPTLLAGCAFLPGRTRCDPGQAAAVSASRAPCLYDPGSETYKECFHVTADGKCAHFGAACQPRVPIQPVATAAAPPCLYDRATGSHRACHHVTADGGCAHFGAACTQ